MSGHEHYEEVKLYPYLCWKFDVKLGFLEKQHQNLHAQEEKLSAILTEIFGLEVEKDEQEQQKLFLDKKELLQKEFLKYDYLLRQHLLEEETCVIPMLLQLTPEEFSVYYDTRVHELRQMMDEERANRPSLSKQRSFLSFFAGS